MAQFLAQKFQENVKNMKKHPTLHKCKMLYLWSFFAGFLLFLLLGKSFIEDISLLSVGALREIKNCMPESDDFWNYILWRRLLFLAAGVIIWWWGFGRWFVYGLIGSAAFSMGICMYTCLMRYRLKGLFLWFFLYFPQAVFYGAALICGMMLSIGTFRTKAEKLKYLWQNIIWLLLTIIMFSLGVYMESCVNVALLQDYLEIF